MSPKREAAFLGGAVLLAVYIFRASDYFLTWDCFNNYAGIGQYAISFLRQGILPLWDPMVGCGAPFYMDFLVLGLFDPLFVLSVLAGKLSGLDVLQTYELWLILRPLPFLLGMFWLLKQLTRHSAVSLAGASFLYMVMFTCLLRDHVFFIVYLPLVLACFVRFARTTLGGAPCIPTFYGMVAAFSVGLLQYNPAYATTMLAGLSAAFAVVAFKPAWAFLAGLRRLRWVHWLGGAALSAAILSPAAVMHRSRDVSEHFIPVRAHQAFLRTHVPFQSRSVSALAGDPLDYVQVMPELSPVRSLWELATCIPGLYYMDLGARMEGPLYAGSLATIGLCVALGLRRSAAARAFSIAAAAFMVLMTPAATPLLRILQPAFPVVGMLNQRHLFYPAFLVCLMVAGCMGWSTIVEPRLAARIHRHLSPLRVFLVGIALLAAGAVVLKLRGQWSLSSYWSPLPLGMLAALPALAASLRAGIRSPSWRRASLWMLAVLLAMDAGFYVVRQSSDHRSDRTPLGASRWLREPIVLRYRAHRTPLLPRIYDSLPHSIVRHAGIPTPHPLYWHSDAMLFGAIRHYELVGALGPEALKPALGVTSPVARLCLDWTEVPPGESALPRLAAMSAEELSRTAVLSAPGSRRSEGLSRLQELSFAGPPRPHKDVNLTPSWEIRPDAERSFLRALYDREADLSGLAVEEVTPGVYHRRLYRMRVPRIAEAGAMDDREALSRFFFPDFPFAIDAAEGALLFSGDFHTSMRIVPGEGLLLEWDGKKGDGPRIPRDCYEHLPLAEAEGVQVVRYSPNRVEVEVQSPTPAVLRYADCHDPHWTATLNGEPTPLWIADHAFKAVKVPAGRSRVAFEYRVPGLVPAILLSLGASAAGFLVLPFLALRKRRA